MTDPFNNPYNSAFKGLGEAATNFVNLWPQDLFAPLRHLNEPVMGWTPLGALFVIGFIASIIYFVITEHLKLKKGKANEKLRQ